MRGKALQNLIGGRAGGGLKSCQQIPVKGFI